MPFLVFEGAEGVGKTTQISMLRDYLTQKGADVLCTREPGGTVFAEKIRDLFKDPSLSEDLPTAWTELLLVAAARAQHIEKVLRPALKANKWVLCDRYLDSAYVYQGIRAGLGCEMVQQLHEGFMKREDFPDLTFVLDLNTPEALERMSARASVSADRLDSEGVESLKVMRQGFLDIVKINQTYPHGEQVKRVLMNAGQPADMIHNEVVRIFSQLKFSEALK